MSNNVRMDTDITYFAKTNFRNKETPFGIRQADRLLHMYVIGKTGTGKSTMLKKMFLQDAEDFRGACLLDPHGDLTREILEAMPEIRKQDIIYFDLPNAACKLKYNPFKRVSYEKRALVTSGILEVFKKLWADAWGVKLEHILRNAILALLDQPEASVADIPRMLLERSFRTATVKNIENPSVKDFWEKEFPKYNHLDLLPVLNKVGGMLAYPTIRRVLVENTEEVFLRQAMDEGKLIIVNLSKGHLGEDVSHILGALFISSISSAAFSRANVDERLRRPFMLYADEFHHFTTLSLVNMFAELRKFKVGMILAHQYMHQLEEDIRRAILGNVGTIVSFRVGIEDAQYLVKEMPVFDVDGFTNLANYSIYLKLMIDGVPSRPFSAATIAFP